MKRGLSADQRSVKRHPMMNSDWGTWIQLLSKLPSLVVGILFVTVAFLFHLRRPGPATVVQICGSLIAFIGSGISLFGQTMLQRQIQLDGSGAIRQWGSLLSISYGVYVIGALMFAFALLLSVFSLPRRDEV
jgi:xanthosine utilization system XapX-like protein